MYRDTVDSSTTTATTSTGITTIDYYTTTASASTIHVLSIIGFASVLQTPVSLA